MSYQIRIYMHPDVESVRGANTLALWEAGWPRWVDELAEAGKLMQTRSDNFPSLYRGAASDILPMLPANRRTSPALYFTPELLQERINVCPRDAELGIEIWDQC